MCETVLLNGTWDLRDEILSRDLADAAEIASNTEGWIPSPVPGDIHQGLIAAGRIEEPLLGLNSFECHWTEERSWWFRKEFEVQASWLSADVIELEMNGLDSNAEIWINDHHIGSHRNAFYPFVQGVQKYLVEGENVLLVRLTSGVEDVSQLDIDAPDGIVANTEADRGRPERGDPRRTMVRKPQYSFGWDWSPRVATTAIAGDVLLRVMDKACLRDVALEPVMAQDGQVYVTATVTIDQFHYYKTKRGTVVVVLTDDSGRRYKAERTVLLRSGYSFVELKIPIAEPRLWWPNGMGEQPLYMVKATLVVDGEQIDDLAFNYGLRFVELETDGTFKLIVNGNDVFCRGGNWIPADAIYARVEDERYDTLIREARDANFNMLRIWGGGRYESDAFYKACDRYGILIWHDFMFACAPYPDHLERFRISVEREADYQTKRLRNHACMALWCGSNENNWGFRDWWNEQTHGGAWMYNYLLPDVVQRNAPYIPYWNGSPYGGEAPNSSEVGDRHHWFDCMMNPDMQKRITPEEYDKCTSLFVSEFGYVGACSKETVLTYLDGAPFDRQEAVWQHHNNTFEKDTVDAGIAKHYADPDILSLDEYLLYSGLCQGLMYSYSLDSMRYRENCHGSLFWMYNDCWGEVGWTIIDYYLRRKPSWFFVRRTYAPKRLIMRADNSDIRVVLANGSRVPVSTEIEYGYVRLDGSSCDLERVAIEAPPLQRSEVCVFAHKEHDPAKGLWIARAIECEDISPAIYRATDYRNLQTFDPQLSMSLVSHTAQSCVLRVTAQGYAHAVHWQLPSGAMPSDCYFDLLPGATREIVISSTEALDLTKIAATCMNTLNQWVFCTRD